VTRRHLPIANTSPKHRKIGFCILDNASSNNAAVRALGRRLNFAGKERQLRCGPHIIHLTVMAMLYGQGSRTCELKELLAAYGDLDFENQPPNEVDKLFAEDGRNNMLVSALEDLQQSDENFHEDDIASVDNEDLSEAGDTQFPAIAAEVFSNTTFDSFERYRRDGPFGKLYNIGVFLRKSSRLKRALADAQQEFNPGCTPLAWVHNSPTRWSSDHAMAERALVLKRALNNQLFLDLEELWVNGGSIPSQRPEILNYKLTPSEWQVVTALQKVLRQFSIANRQLQRDPAVNQNRQIYSRFDEYFPIIEVLLDHLKTAVQGSIVEESPEFMRSNQPFHTVPIFEGMLVPTPAFGFY
jgi:hypothetical protein